jgi:ribosome-binding protein aMBF1 (putative translation factor)
MNETIVCCGRCGHTIEGAPIGVSMDGGPLHETDPILHICPNCAGSLTRWLERGRRRAVPPSPILQKSTNADDQARHRKHRSHDDQTRRKQRKALLRNVGLVALLVLVNVMVMFVLIKLLHSPSEQG